MSQNPEIKVASRRQFFKAAGIGAVAAAGAGSVAGPAPAAAAETTAQSAGYAETAHVKTYYALAK
ncbi:MAG: formate dehydrogenase [Rhodospirillales bacterium]|nr:formate dehydrogenase [Rhodospirillales bacterium]